MRYLIDTCVWRDFYEGRRNRQGRPLHALAADFFRKVLAGEATVLTCEPVVRELKGDYPEKELHEMFGLLAMTGKLERIDIAGGESEEAEIMAIRRNLPVVDCLLAIAARNRNVIVVTRDYHFFQRLADVCIARRPEDVF